LFVALAQRRRGFFELRELALQRLPTFEQFGRVPEGRQRILLVPLVIEYRNRVDYKVANLAIMTLEGDRFVDDEFATAITEINKIALLRLKDRLRPA